MEEWPQDFWKALETVTDEVERFFIDVTKEVTEAIDDFVDLSEEVVEQFAIEFDQHFYELVEPFLDLCLGFEEGIEEAAQPMMHTVEPILNEHPACVGCRHYHGQIYGGHPLVCAMHPYGWEDENCPDWESTWTN